LLMFMVLVDVHGVDDFLMEGVVWDVAVLN